MIFHHMIFIWYLNNSMFQILLSEILINTNNKLLVENIKDKRCLTDATRKLLVDSIVQYFIEKKKSMTVAMCKSIADQICKTFPDEIEVIFNIII